MNRLYTGLNPETISVIGGKEAGRVIEQCQKAGFQGRIHAVNPKTDRLAGIRCVANVNDLPESPDIAFVAIPAEPTIDVISSLSEIGCEAAICYASGFNEVGDSERHRRLIEAAGEMPVIGPNCYGYINAISGAALWPDQHGLERISTGVAIFSSSGNVSINITMQQRSLPIALILTIGNQAMTGIEHGIEAVLEDPRITAIGIHIEGLRNLAMFTQLAVKAAGSGKPIVALKTGRSQLGASITMSHTATLAGESALYDALFERVGVATVESLEDFLECLKLVSVTGRLETGRIACMSCSGGEASLIADLIGNEENADKEGRAHFPTLGSGHADMVRTTLNEYVAVSNPLDYHTFIWGDKERLQATFKAMLRGNFDLCLLILDYPCVNDCDMTKWVEASNAFIAACRQTGARGAIVSSLSENIPREIRDDLMTREVVPLLGMTHAVNAIRAATQIGRVSDVVPEFSARQSSETNVSPEVLDEDQTKTMLAEAGMPVVPGQLVNTVTEAVSAAETIGYPVVLKANGKLVTHKTELSAVVLSIDCRSTVEIETGRLLEIGEGVLVEKMVSDGVVELLLGVGCDAEFGHYLIIGYGGTLVELIADRQIILLPASRSQIRKAILDLKMAPLLQGYRGKPPADIEAAVDCVEGLCQFVSAHQMGLREVDINPLIVRSEGNGAAVADAMLVFDNNRASI